MHRNVSTAQFVVAQTGFQPKQFEGIQKLTGPDISKVLSTQDTANAIAAQKAYASLKKET